MYSILGGQLYSAELATTQGAATRSAHIPVLLFTQFCLCKTGRVYENSLTRITINVNSWYLFELILTNMMRAK